MALWLKREVLQRFLAGDVGREEAQASLDEDLMNLDIEVPIDVSRDDIAFMLTKLRDGRVVVSHVLDWVLVLRQTTLYDWSEEDMDSICSVLDALEALENPSVRLHPGDINEMITCLESNEVWGG